MPDHFATIRPFEELGREIGAAWKRLNYDEKAFPALAAEGLVGARLHARVDPVDVVGWLGTNDTPPTQVEPGNFGEPPIVVYRGRRFYIEMIFWLDGVTSIHQHGFSGAFGVLAGESVETSYDFRVTERVNARMLLCDIVPQGVRLLETGAVHDIVAGEAGAHSLFHLSRPSVSVVVRTVAEVEAQPQYQYLRPFLAVDPFATDALIDRRTRALNVLLVTGNERFDELATASMVSADLEMAYHLLGIVHAHEGLSDRYQRLAEHGAVAHGETIRRFTAVHEERARERTIVALRSRIHDEDHRFFLALLLNVPERGMVLELINQRFPGEDADSKIESWLRQLSGSAGIGLEVDEMTIALYRLLRVPRSLDEVLEHVNGQVERGDYRTTGRQVMHQYGQLRESLLLRPLIAR